MALPKPLPPAAQLWELFVFQPLTGRMYRRVRTSNNNQPGDRVGGRTQRHHTVQIDGSQYKLHRVIWKWVTGRDPDGILEHIEDDSNDNRFWRLLDSDDRANRARYCARQRSLPTGVHLANGKYVAQMSISMQKYFLGHYTTVEDADWAYNFALGMLQDNPDWRPPKG